MTPEQIKGLIESAVDGLVSSAGAPAVDVEARVAPDGKTSYIVVREGYGIQTLEGQKTGRRLHTFGSIVALGQWLRRYAAPMEAEILGDASKIQAVLYPMDPQSDLVTCPLTVHPRVAAWTKLLGQPLGQRQLWQFVRARAQDFAPAVSARGSDLGSYGPILAAELQKLEVAKGTKISTQIDHLGQVVFQAGEAKTEVSGKLPASFEIRVPLYRGVQLAGVEPTYTLEVYLSMGEAKGDGDIKQPVFSLECPGLELAQLQAQEDALACLRETLAGPEPEGYLVGLGSLKVDVVPLVDS